MPLVPKSAPAVPNSASASSPPDRVAIDVSEESLQLAGVRTAVAEKGALSRTLRAVGIVRADETRTRQVHTKIAGWVERLYVRSTGESVKAGQPILSIYSQELLAAQYEYLQARQSASAARQPNLPGSSGGLEEMVAAARRRLELLDVPEAQLLALERTGVPSRTVVLTAPVSGVVMTKSVFEGQQIDPGLALFTVTDLSKVWVEGDLYENEASAVKVGAPVNVSFPGAPGQVIHATIQYIYPYLDAATRTLRVRVVLPNPQQSLKLESYVNLELPVETAEGVIVPDSAILDTGLRQLVFVNTRPGHFEPRLVTVGVRADGRAQLLSGVAAGESVVTRANFLLDSESRLRAALAPSPTTTAPSAEADAASAGAQR